MGDDFDEPLEDFKEYIVNGHSVRYPCIFLVH